MDAAPNRRERLRAATLDEINSTARRLLVADGPAGVSLRAIAREMGMTAPALYRYYPSLVDLLGTLCASLYHELSDHLEKAQHSAMPDDPGVRLQGICREFRRWSVAHPAEFGLMFGSPLPNRDTIERVQAEAGSPEAPMEDPGVRFASVFLAQFAEIWLRAPFPVPEPDEIAPELREQLVGYLTMLGADLPVGAAQVFLSCWIRLYGIVALEVFGHLQFALANPEPMFEVELAALGGLLGLDLQISGPAEPSG